MSASRAAAILRQANLYQEELQALRRDVHAHPELGLDTQRTADIVATRLQSWGVEVHRMVNGAGVVGVLRHGNGKRSVGLRADMDALPIHEQTGKAWSSTKPGLQHACGHDGHTAMLLGAARYLAETKAFNGRVNFIFQPGEEGAGGAVTMLGEGLLSRFPSDELYGLHNRPGAPVGHFSITPGTAMAGAAFFDISITGGGGHAARPDLGIDPVVVAFHIGTALQTVVTRNLAPGEMGVLSITKVAGGEAYNVIPDVAYMGGTVRAMKKENLSLMETSLRRIAIRVAEGLGASASVDFRLLSVPLVNSTEQTRAIVEAAVEMVGESWVDTRKPPAAASEDFAFMLEKAPGAFINLGNGERSAQLHSDRYDFNDDAIPYGVALFAHLVERRLGDVTPG